MARTKTPAKAPAKNDHPSAGSTKQASTNGGAKQSPFVEMKRAVEEEYDANEGRRVLGELQARHGHVGDEHRAAFDTLSNEAKRAALGGRTKAMGVLKDGVAWVVQIDHAITKYPAVVLDHYSKERYTYLLDRLVELDGEVSGEAAQREGTGLKRETSAQREKTARETRAKVVEKMQGFAGQRDEEKAALATATGTTETTANLGQSIQNLVALGRSWLARKDKVSPILCKSAGLTEELLTSALAAAEALTGAATDAKLAGRKLAADSPSVNLIEGWVLQEMQEAQRCFENANKQSNRVSKLTPGPATRSVLGARKTDPGANAATDATPATQTPAATPA